VPGEPIECLVQLRAHGMVSPAVVSLGGTDPGDLVVELRTPQRGVAAGQALVMYDGGTVLGSATITDAA
jgi:tRNA-specific 2-thiouridylase